MRPNTIYSDAYATAIERGLTATDAERCAMDAAADFAERAAQPCTWREDCPSRRLNGVGACGVCRHNPIH